MKVSLFDFDLPRASIALRPARPRDAARMLLVGDGGLRDSFVAELESQLQAGDMLVFNDTKVIPGRLYGKRGEANVEVTLHKREATCTWRVFARPAKKCRLDDILTFGDLQAKVTHIGDAGERTLEFLVSPDAMMPTLVRCGEMPLPPYIASQRAIDAADADDYQTMFARVEGAVAAPTAALHFTDDMMARLKAKGVLFQYLTLHVGAGTFLPVKVDDTEDHIMHSEWGLITEKAAGAMNAVRAQGGRLVAIGTTSLRLMESAADAEGLLHEFEGDTDIFITPGYKFRAVDLLMTNFHLPKSTLFMLVSAFAGSEVMQDAYRHAIDTGYRFYSYGDSSLLYPKDSSQR